MLDNIACFTQISPLVGELLVKYDTPKIYTDNPSVDIIEIAKACGIEQISYRSAEKLDGNHAVFENGILEINESDPIGKQLFAIAHEIGHLKLCHIDPSKNYKVARHGKTKISTFTDPRKKAEDESADYFAANLLVPIERFLLWEDKSDQEIAAAFKVEVKCIQKRRLEVERDLAAL